ncbi:maleylacetoacetate isomerase [Glaciecola sp. XM2]|jgi:maleylacetoacetate isomerase|uniref:maleylacetoacetate isomerase n=1 Tax=Glaciecola sp. XM2 TaxID=1914931 RepID=UPI001BDE0048|nr:maleylacetoacetate isomerase [Glaciecola sp. XM2]MBT1450877.1 maleylacetoacetate isomerase [Glaciecola sp. XM2]
MSLKLYGYWRSSASYRVRIALNLKQLEYTYIPVHLVNGGGEQNSDDYQRLNPSKLVPTLVDDDADITLNQSMAIIEYLDEKFPDISPLMPKHAQDRARVRSLSQDIACDTQPLVNLRVLQQLKSEYGASEEQVRKWVQHWANRTFAALSKKLETRAGKFSYGYQVTLIDLCLVPQVYSAIRFGVDMQEFPLIDKIYKNCLALEAFAQAAPEVQIDAAP